MNAVMIFPSEKVPVTLGRIRYASNFDPTLVDSIWGINTDIGISLSAFQSEQWCIHADLT